MTDAALRAAVFGATGTGKTAWLIQRIDAVRPPRLMVWDFKHDHTLEQIAPGYADWPGFVRACCKPRFSARYMPNHDLDMQQQFQAFCLLAWREGNLLMVVDELAEVTKSNRAPPAWRKLVNVSRSYDGGTKTVAIIGASQRPAEVDKSFLSNCDLIHTGRLSYLDDARQFARAWGIDAAELVNLPNLAYIEKRAASPDVVRGVLSFGNKTKKWRTDLVRRARPHF